MKIDNHYQATVIGLTLAITAPTDAHAEKVMTILNDIIHHLTDRELEQAKTEALEQVGPEDKRRLASLGTHITKGRSIWRLL